MYEQTFEILGIAPTNDGRAIRSAFLRLARIYHPDRLADMPDDVREEAERRMKEATAAYETLRTAGRTAQRDKPAIGEPELKARAERFREAMRAREAQEQRDRERWRRWEEIELEARERARIDAEIEALVRSHMDPSELFRTNSSASQNGDAATPPKKAESLLTQRLDAARRGETSPLARRVEQTQ